MTLPGVFTSCGRRVDADTDFFTNFAVRKEPNRVWIIK